MQVSNLDATTKELTVGTIINASAVVVMCEKKFDRVVGDCYATWLAICNDLANPLHPYVVWTVVARPEGFVAGNGDYRKTLTEAVEAYEARGGHIS
jgi:hypothetical protein